MSLNDFFGCIKCRNQQLCTCSVELCPCLFLSIGSVEGMEFCVQSVKKLFDDLQTEKKTMKGSTFASNCVVMQHVYFAILIYV